MLTAHASHIAEHACTSHQFDTRTLLDVDKQIEKQGFLQVCTSVCIMLGTVLSAVHFQTHDL